MFEQVNNVVQAKIFQGSWELKKKNLGPVCRTMWVENFKRLGLGWGIDNGLSFFTDDSNQQQ